MGCRLLLGSVFLMGAVAKITDLREFEARLVVQTALPVELVVAVARVLPWLELVCGVCLLLGTAVREAAVLVTLLLLAFLVHGLTRIGEADCGCLLFPFAEPAVPWWYFVRDGVLLLCSLRLSIR